MYVRPAVRRQLTQKNSLVPAVAAIKHPAFHPQSQRTESSTLNFLRTALHIAHDLIHMNVSSLTCLDALLAEGRHGTPSQNSCRPGSTDPVLSTLLWRTLRGGSGFRQTISNAAAMTNLTTEASV